MKKRNLLLGAVGLSVVAAGVIVSPVFKGSEKAVYSPKENANGNAYSADGAQAIYHYMHTNHETGEVMDREDYIRTQEEFELMRQNRSTLLSWRDEGPANIGGRTRAVCIHRENYNYLLAGSVTGGLFESWSGANNWTYVDEYPGDLNISSIVQTIDGTFYIGTGMDFNEGYFGNGIWTKSGDTWAQLSGTAGMPKINELAVNDVDNTVWIAAGSEGLHKYSNGTLVEVSGTNGLPNNPVREVEVSSDGQIVVVGVNRSTDIQTFVSVDGGNSFTDYSNGANSSNPIPFGSKNRVEYSISDEKVDGENYIYAVFANRVGGMGHFGGAYVSQNTGRDWFELAPNVSNTNPAELFNPVASGSNPQGNYNLVLAATPWEATGFFVGGIDVYRWKRQVDSPPFGDFKQVSQWFVNPQSSSYVHADNHEIIFDINNKMYIGNDGGIGVNQNPEENFASGFGMDFYPANRNYNVTQFYDIAYSGNGDVIGGTQDNGTLYNNHQNATYQDFKEMLGGDGFDCAISAFNPDVMFGSSQYGNIRRTNDGGEAWTEFVPNYPGTYGTPGSDGGSFAFYTSLALGEKYDENSQDTVNFIAPGSFTVGQEVKVPSLSSGDTILYTMTQNTLFQDTAHYNPSLDELVYVVEDEITGNNFDLSVFENSIAPFVTTTSVTPPTVGDSIQILSNGVPFDTIIVASFTTYNVHYAEHPTDGRTVFLGTDTLKKNVAWDTIRVQDPFQSWFFSYVPVNGGEIWGTRDALRFSSADPTWVKISDNIGIGFGTAVPATIEISHDLSQVYIASANGLKLITGLDAVYSQNPDFETLVDASETGNAIVVSSVAGISNAGSVAFDPDNADHIIVGPAGVGSIRESFNATSGSPTFTAVPGLNTTIYDVELIKDVSDANTGTYIAAGTDEGVWIRNGSTWEECSEGFGKVPVEKIEYAWRTYDQGNYFYGAVYIGTYGRGIWKSTSFLSTPDAADYPSFDDGVKTGLTVFPNPMIGQGFVSFSLENEEEVALEVYSITGRLMKKIAKKQMQKGDNKIEFDANDLPSGAYLIRMTAGSRTEISKFVKN